jgi:hypothetical protein
VGVGWRFVPSTRLGGDLFGHRRLGRDHLAIYLPDVSGHGVGPSLLALSAANLLSAGSLPDADFRDPAAAVARPSDVFQMERQSGKYFTTFYGVYIRGARTGLLRRRPPDLAGAGRERLGSMGRTTQQLVESAGSISSELATIREKADNITQGVTTTTQAAGQTDLLSSNAASEAEKADEHGRGPLVVAREARRLAGQTAATTLGVESRVRLMQDAVSAGVMQTDKFGGGGALRRRPGGGGQRPDRPDHRGGGRPRRALRLGQRGDAQPGGRRPGGPSRPA